MAENEVLCFLTTGPIIWRAEDLFPFLRAIAGPDGEDEGCLAYDLGDPDAVDIVGMPVLDVRDNGVVRVSAELQTAQARAASHLLRRGAVARQTRVRGLRRSFEIWSAMLNDASSTSFSELLGNGRPIAAGRELLRWGAGRSAHTFPALGLAAIESFPLVNGQRAAHLADLGRSLRDELEALIGDGVMLYPSYATVAPRHGRPILTPWQWVYTAIINVLELPATQVPLGLNPAGIPLGVQVIGRRGNDHVTIAVARELERAFGGWSPPRRVA